MHTPLVYFSIEIADKFHKILTRQVSGNPAPSILMSSGFFTWNSAIQLSFSGQFFPIPPLCRAVIETALYAHLIAQSDENFSRWSNPPKDHKKKITAKEGIRSLKKQGISFADELEREYEEFIAFGAHPNRKGISRQLSMEENNKGLETELVGIQHPSGKTMMPITMAINSGIRASHIYAITTNDETLAKWSDDIRNRLLKFLNDTFYFNKK